jgi:predicted CopG family antitoxin
MFKHNLFMTSKTITVREEAYYALKSLGTKTKEEYEIELDELSTRRENFFQGRI